MRKTNLFTRLTSFSLILTILSSIFAFVGSMTPIHQARAACIETTDSISLSIAYTDIDGISRNASGDAGEGLTQNTSYVATLYVQPNSRITIQNWQVQTNGKGILDYPGGRDVKPYNSSELVYGNGTSDPIIGTKKIQAMIEDPDCGGQGLITFELSTTQPQQPQNLVPGDIKVNSVIQNSGSSRITLSGTAMGGHTSQTVQCTPSGLGGQPFANGTKNIPYSNFTDGFLIDNSGPIIPYNFTETQNGITGQTCNGQITQVYKDFEYDLLISDIDISNLSDGDHTITIFAHNDFGNQFIKNFSKSIVFRIQRSTGTIQVQATLNGNPWTGTLGHSLTGPEAVPAGNAVPATYSNKLTGLWNISSAPTFGGPGNGYSLVGVQPSSSGTLTQGSTMIFTYVFKTQYTLSVTKSGLGTVTSNPSGINCGADCSEVYLQGDDIILSATPDPGYSVQSWSINGVGACVSSTTCLVNISGNTAVNVVFRLNQYTLSISKSGTGQGTVTSSPGGITCGADCTENYNSNTSVTLTGVGINGSVFAGWSGEGCSGTGTCIVSMTQARNVTAQFNSANFTVTVNRSGAGSGTIVSNPSGINCGLTCTASFVGGTSVTLSIQRVSAGSTFTGWSGGGCSGTGTCTVSSTQTITANFTLNTYALTIAKAGAGQGTVTSSPGGINCGADCTENYTFGTSVTLTSTPAPGSTFTGWSGGGCSGTGTCNITMNQIRSVTATYTIGSYTLDILKSGTGSGTITDNLGYISCGSSCSASYPVASNITLTATPTPGSIVSNWTVNGTSVCGNNSSCPITFDSAKIVSVTFSTILPTATISSTSSTCVGRNPRISINFSTSNATSWSLVRIGTGIIAFNPPSPFLDTNRLEGQDSEYRVDVTGPGGSAQSSIVTQRANWCTVPIVVNAYRDGLPVNTYYTVFGPTASETYTHSSVNSSTDIGLNDSAGYTWNISANSIAGTTLSISPASSITSGVGNSTTRAGTITFNLNYTTQVPTTIDVSGDAAARRNDPFTIAWTSTNATQVVSSSFGCGTGPVSGAQPNGSVNVTCATTGIKSFTITVRNAAGQIATDTHTVNITTASPRTLSVNKVGTGQGTVTSNPSGINCGLSCSSDFARDSVVTLTATPTPGSTFTGWSGGTCNGTDPCNVTMNSNQNITARFTLGTYSVSVIKPGSGQGTVTSSPTGIDCGSICSSPFSGNQVVTLTATIQPGSTFTGWSGGGCSGTGTCTVSSTQTITANFTLNTYALTIAKAGAGQGTVTSSPGGINCGADCTENYTFGTSVTLTSTPAPGSTFTGWSGGGCSGTAPCTVTMNQIRSVTAGYIIAGPSGSMNVSSNCQSTTPYATYNALSFTYNNATSATLTRNPGFGSINVFGTNTYNDTAVSQGISYTYFLTISGPGGTAIYSGTQIAHYCSGNISVAAYRNGVLLTGSDGVRFTIMGPTVADNYIANTSNSRSVRAERASSGYTWTAFVNPSDYPTGTNSLSVTNAFGQPGSAQTMQAGNKTTPVGNLIFNLVFASPSYSLTVTKPGTGQGTITSNPAGITCGIDCTENYTGGTSVTLTATPTPGSTFTGWSGGGCSGTGTCVVPMNANQNVSATFTLLNVSATINSINYSCSGANSRLSVDYSFANALSLTLTRSGSAPVVLPIGSGTGSGTYSDPSNLNPGTNYQYTLTATGVSGPSTDIKSQTTRFCFGDITVRATLNGSSWSGPEVLSYLIFGPNSDIKLSVPQTHLNFQSGTYSVTRLIGGPAGATYSGNPGNQVLPSDQTTEPSLIFTMAFTLASPSYSLTVTKPGTGQGTITSNPAGITCGIDCTENYTGGTSVTLTATPTPGSTFTGWSGGGCSGTGTCVVPMNANQNVSATFNTIVLPPNPPASLIVDNTAQCGQISLSWIDSSSDELGFHIWRSPSTGGTTTSYNGNTYSLIQTLGINTASYTDSPATGQSYLYIVTSYNPSGESSINSGNASGSVFNNTCSPNLNLSGKDIAQINQGTGFVSYTGQTINNGDIIKFRVVITNSGTSPAYDVYVEDTMSANLIYEVGTGRLQKGSGASTPVSEQVSGQTIYFDASRNLGDKDPDGTNWVLTFDARVQTASSGVLDYFNNSAKIYYSLTNGGAQSDSVTKSTGSIPARTGEIKKPDFIEI